MVEKQDSENEQDKKGRGRPVIDERETKLKTFIENKGWTRSGFIEKVRKANPENPVSADALSRIVNGFRTDYKLSTLYRICKATNLTPNEVLDYEDEVGLIIADPTEQESQ